MLVAARDAFCLKVRVDQGGKLLCVGEWLIVPRVVGEEEFVLAARRVRGGMVGWRFARMAREVRSSSAGMAI